MFQQQGQTQSIPKHSSAININLNFLKAQHPSKFVWIRETVKWICSNLALKVKVTSRLTRTKNFSQIGDFFFFPKKSCNSLKTGAPNEAPPSTNTRLSLEQHSPTGSAKKRCLQHLLPGVLSASGVCHRGIPECCRERPRIWQGVPESVRVCSGTGLSCYILANNLNSPSFSYLRLLLNAVTTVK